MEAALLMFDVVGIGLVLLWAARGRGTLGLFAWRGDPAAGRPGKPRLRD
jgi:hypothetical protein